ncbi:hypothetical protein V6N12_065000 [Hibiscus sabdariffa]|uniref:Uncharacterized protein n=1 Tax=Hibiscus sabdariffa TaxID=183260 RepID=A0ABR2G7F4_9ROSI
MGGGMEANKNRFIEDWSSARENLEHNFRWTRRNFALVGIFGIALPVLVYKGIVREFHMQDEDNGVYELLWGFLGLLVYPIGFSIDIDEFGGEIRGKAPHLGWRSRCSTLWCDLEYDACLGLS